MSCHICHSNDFNILCPCKGCSKFYCPQHASEIEPTLCSVCVSFSNTNITEKPLVDSDGVTHKGRQLILSGEAWMRSRDLISKMTEVELEAKLLALKEAVHEAEMVLDYRRIMKEQVENELASRFSKKLARLRIIKGVDELHKSANGSKKVEAKSDKDSIGTKTADALKALKGLGFDKNQMANFLLKLAQKKPAEKKNDNPN